MADFLSLVPLPEHGKHLGYNNTTVTTCSCGDHRRNLQRIGAIEIFPFARLNAFANVRKDQVKHLICKLSQNSIPGFAKVELKFMFSELTFNIIMTMVTGKRYYGNGDDVSVDKEEAGQFWQIMKEIFAHSIAANRAD
ncbi:unnamed protein product [Prunus armeniaca]|uniref:Uncharacterized protein n=1 Tax=Prunus armeniaca TaxID=36596 RepID=A0A6J5XQC1_PRUAR|nr:unnamed protein product [Prunus armeniaca]